MSGPVLCTMLVWLPETSADTILFRRAQRLRRITGNPNISSQPEITRGDLPFSRVVLLSLAKPLEIMVKDPAIFFTNLYTSLVYGIYYSFFEAFPLVYPFTYGFNLGETALSFLSIIVACALGMAVYILYLYIYLMPDLIKHGHRAQEHRLIPALFASMFAPAGLLIFGTLAIWSSISYYSVLSKRANIQIIQRGLPGSISIGV